MDSSKSETSHELVRKQRVTRNRRDSHQKEESNAAVQGKFYSAFHIHISTEETEAKELWEYYSSFENLIQHHGEEFKCQTTNFKSFYIR